MEKVLFYALTTCPGCRKTRKFFLDNNVEFEYLEYDSAGPEEQAEIRKNMDASGTPSFPWVRIGETVVVGYNPVLYAELLGLKLEKKPWER
ncbi:MAG: glutaredoxin family protein [Thermodesulfobacteriota bacterium]